MRFPFFTTDAGLAHPLGLAVITPFDSMVDGTIDGRLVITPSFINSDEGNYSVFLSFYCLAVVPGTTASVGPNIISTASVIPAAGRTRGVALSKSSLTNISTRAVVGRGDEIEIAGFIVAGSDPKTLLIRANGPALKKHGVAGVLEDPVLELFDGSQKRIARNDDWSNDVSKGAVIKQTVAKANLPGWDEGSKDAAFVVTVPPGAYTAQISGKNSSTGVALIEVFDISGPTVGSRLCNISTRSRVDTDERIQIAGFIVSGPTERRLLIRASGPTLRQYGVASLLQNPRIEIKSGQTTVAANDDWDASGRNAFQVISASNSVNAFQLEGGSREAAVVVTLSPGPYTVLVSGENRGTGIALVEVYDLD